MTAKNKSRFINRELSWLEFNQRVLEEAKKSENPMLERLRFLAITALNLDEFYMVRVGGLQVARKAGQRKKDPSGLTPLSQIQEIKQRSKLMMEQMYRCFNDVICPALEKGGIQHADIHSLSSVQEAALFELFSEELFPVVTPVAVTSAKTFPTQRNLSLQVLIRLESQRAKDHDSYYAVMSLDRTGPRLIRLPTESGYLYVLREEVIKKYAANWFPGYDVKETALFRITRNTDFAVQEDEAPDLVTGMENVLEARKSGDCIRLEVEDKISKALLKFLLQNIPCETGDVFPVPGFLNLSDFMALVPLEGYEDLKVEAWPPQLPTEIIPNEPMFDQIAQRDILLYHPYVTYDPVIRFIEEAAADQDVMAIRMVLYRTSEDSAVVTALKRAAENGINVTVLMELKARFDEARNIGWARDLEQCGVQVIYGVKGYKTHAKICLVVRREPHGIARYCHFGTGNYNESTARFYTDVSFMTCNPELGEDASGFFNALCGYAQPHGFNLISMAPIGIRNTLVELIEFETERAEKGKKALINAKMNALVDVALINKLYEAAKAGVRIRLNVRGICCLKPIQNIEIISIVDRFLEHARIIHFHHAGKPRVFISSADWMPRNLDKRLELLVPVEDEKCRNRLIDILDTHFSDNQNAWRLEKSGQYRRVAPGALKKVRSQNVFYQQACDALIQESKTRRTRFEPHRGSSK